MQLLVLVGMIGVSVWGRSAVPDDARVRARAGATGLDWTMSKITALVSTPIIGALVFLATVVPRDPANEETIAILGVVVMLIFLAAHWSAIKRAGR